MNIFKQQYIALASVFTLESVNRIMPEGMNHFIAEIFSGYIVDAVVRIFRQYVVTDGLGKMAFAHSGL